MQRLYEARDEIEAQMLIDYLASSHIQANIQGSYLKGAAGELMANHFPAVWVMQNEDMPRAQQLLALFLQQPKQEAWVCEKCHAEVDAGFGICWKCGAAREI